MSKETEPLINKVEAAKTIGISVHQINRLIGKREIPHYKMGASQASPVFFKKSELERWLKRFQVSVA